MGTDKQLLPFFLLTFSAELASPFLRRPHGTLSIHPSVTVLIA